MPCRSKACCDLSPTSSTFCGLLISRCLTWTNLVRCWLAGRWLACLLWLMFVTGVLVTNHHPFTAPLPEDIPLLATEPRSVRSLHYDCVLNGVELGGGSIRVHDLQLQQHIMRDCLHLSPSLMGRFEHLFDALRLGCPPHGGIAIGFDRLVRPRALSCLFPAAIVLPDISIFGAGCAPVRHQ